MATRFSTSTLAPAAAAARRRKPAEREKQGEEEELFHRSESCTCAEMYDLFGLS